MRRVALKTVGCRLNRADTARIAAQFVQAGYRLVPFGEPCEVGVVQTCAVTAKADSQGARLARSLKKAQPGAVVVLAGCAVEAARPERRRAWTADLLAGQEDKFRLPEILARLGLGPEPAPGCGPPVPAFDTRRALVKIQDGCDFRCAYCVVPLARGAPRSRPFAEVVEETRRLAGRGHREAVLTGANAGCYRDGSRRLVDLLEAVERIPGLDRVRLSSIEVTTTEREVIDYMAGSARMCRSLHLPLQSGDDGVLAAMGRRYTAREYRGRVEYALGRMPFLGLGADVMAGLPGESEAAFRNTVALVRDLPFSNLHVFPYSRREGTPAAAMPRQTAAAEKKRRAAELAEIGHAKREAFKARFIGREVSVLVENVRGDRGTGWTGEYLEAEVARPGIRVNDIVAFRPARVADGVLGDPFLSCITL